MTMQKLEDMHAICELETTPIRHLCQNSKSRGKNAELVQVFEMEKRRVPPESVIPLPGREKKAEWNFHDFEETGLFWS